MLGKLLQNSVRISFGLIHFIYRNYYWNFCCFSVINCFYCLRHNTIICCNNYNYYISNRCTSCPHFSKCSMSWSINKSYFLTVITYLVCSYMLSYTTKFTFYYVTLSNGI